jgi:methanogenic corrinoid protein MtbC1
MDNSNQSNGNRAESPHFPENSEEGHWRGFGAPANSRFDGTLGTAPIVAATSATTVAVLARTIQNEIIPRLMMAHRTPTECAMPNLVIPYSISAADVANFVDLLLEGRQSDGLDWIEEARGKGVSIESIFLNLLAPAARQLGELWEDDERDFTEVTLGLAELHKILHVLPSMSELHKQYVPNGLTILLMPSPGDQHTFGLAMVAEFFQRDGWAVDGGTFAAADNPALLVKAKRYDAVGFSLATGLGFNRLQDCISAIRKTVSPDKLCIIVGGPFFVDNPDKVSLVGADLFVQDANLAPGMVQKYIQANVSSN